jgi:glycosyltransferase involved in cell wall biosynthesis
MKICFLSDPRYLHTQRWARFFVERGHEVHIIGDPIVDNPRSAQIPTHSWDIARFRGPWILRTTLALARRLRQLRPDILHMHYLTPLAAPVLLRFRPFIVSVWGADILGEKGLAADDRRIRFLKNLVLRRAHAVLAASAFLADATRRYAGLRADRVTVYPWGVDLHEFRPVPRARPSPAGDGPIVIGFVKHLEPKYGLEYLIRAIPSIRARHPSIRVLVLGGGSERARLEHLAASLSVSDVVSFLGRVPHDEVPRHMAKMDIFVMPSVHQSETFGIAAVEAQAMGIPVVASRIGGVPEAVVENRTALLVPPRDSDALSQAVVRLIEEPELRRSMSREGRLFAERCYEWRRNAGRVEALYGRLLSRSPVTEGA